MCLCGRPWSVCEVVLVPYVDAVVVETVIRVLLFVLYVCMLRECEGAMVTKMLVWGPGRWVVVSAEYAYMGGTRGSCFVFTADDVLEMSVVRGVRGVGGEMCICLAKFVVFHTTKKK